jgi:hypothetical protein
MSFNEWYFENLELLEESDIKSLRTIWKALEEEGLSDGEIEGVFSGIINAYNNGRA